MMVTLGQQYNIGEKPTVVLNTYIDRHTGAPYKQPRQINISTLSNNKYDSITTFETSTDDHGDDGIIQVHESVFTWK